jgi:hypothetical protein
MPTFSALVFARRQDAVHLDRALKSLKVANDILLINGDRDPQIHQIGRRHHARSRDGIPGVTPGAYLMDAFHRWILVLRPFEALSNNLIRSLQDWKNRKEDESRGYSFGVLQQGGRAWHPLAPELRLVNRDYVNWVGELPPGGDAPLLRGSLLRYETGQREQRIAS